MNDALVDTDVLIRLLTGDDPAKQQAALALFQRVRDGRLILRGPDTVIADAVFVLRSPRLYRKSRAEVQALLTPLLRLPNFKLSNRRMLIRALDVYASTNLDFGDAMIVAAVKRGNSNVLFSYDRDFDRMPGVVRHEP